MIPFIIAGAIGFGIAKLLEKDDAEKFADGGGAGLYSKQHDKYKFNVGDRVKVTHGKNKGIKGVIHSMESDFTGITIKTDNGHTLYGFDDADLDKFADGGGVNLGYAKKNWDSYTKDTKKNDLVEAGYSKKVAENLSSEAWESLEKQVQNAFKNVQISKQLEYMKSMMESLYTYGGLNKDNDYLSKYKVSLGNKLFNKTFDEYKKELEEGYDVDYGTYTDSEGSSYSSLKRKLKEGGIIQDSWRKSGEGNLSIAETKKVAKKYAEGLTMSGEGIFTVNPKVEENSFDLDFNDEEYDGGSYIIYGDGSVVNMAVNPSERYGSINSTPTQIKNKFIDIQKQYKNAEFKDLIRNDGSVYGKRMVSELKYDNGGGTYVDLFEDYENIPLKVQKILDKYAEEFGDDFGGMDYKDTQNMLEEIEEVGYTFGYGLDNQPYGLRPMGVRLNQLKNYEDYDDDEMAKGGETFMAGGMTNEDILRSFLTSNRETQTNNLATFYSTLGAVMLLRNYGTLIAKRNGRRVEITNVKHSKTTSAITNRLKALAEEMGYNVSYVSEFAQGGMTEHGLMAGDNIIGKNPYQEESVFIMDKSKNLHNVNLDKGIRMAEGGEAGYSKKERVIDYYYQNDIFDDYETYGLSEDDLNNEDKVVKSIIKYHGLNKPENVDERFEILFGEDDDEYAKGGLAKKRRRSASIQYGGTDKLVDKTRFAKPVGYRFTDEFAKKKRRVNYAIPKKEEIKQFLGNGIYKESRRNRSDRNRKVKL